MSEKEIRKYIEELYKTCNTDSILIIDARGELVRLICPFPVMVIKDVHILKKGQIKPVSAVRVSLELINVYVIESVSYYCYNFIIINNMK